MYVVVKALIMATSKYSRGDNTIPFSPVIKLLDISVAQNTPDKGALKLAANPPEAQAHTKLFNCDEDNCIDGGSTFCTEKETNFAMVIEISTAAPVKAKGDPVPTSNMHAHNLLNDMKLDIPFILLSFSSLL